MLESPRFFTSTLFAEYMVQCGAVEYGIEYSWDGKSVALVYWFDAEGREIGYWSTLSELVGAVKRVMPIIWGDDNKKRLRISPATYRDGTVATRGIWL